MHFFNISFDNSDFFLGRSIIISKSTTVRFSLHLEVDRRRSQFSSLWLNVKRRVNKMSSHYQIFYITETFHII